MYDKTQIFVLFQVLDVEIVLGIAPGKIDVALESDAMNWTTPINEVFNNSIDCVGLILPLHNAKVIIKELYIRVGFMSCLESFANDVVNFGKQIFCIERDRRS